MQGDQFAISEFLTPQRQELFTQSRKVFGMRNCWSLDGNIHVKLSLRRPWTHRVGWWYRPSKILVPSTVFISIRPSCDRKADWGRHWLWQPGRPVSTRWQEWQLIIFIPVLVQYNVEITCPCTVSVDLVLITYHLKCTVYVNFVSLTLYFFYKTECFVYFGRILWIWRLFDIMISPVLSIRLSAFELMILSLNASLITNNLLYA